FGVRWIWVPGRFDAHVSVRLTSSVRPIRLRANIRLLSCQYLFILIGFGEHPLLVKTGKPVILYLIVKVD
ncbi:hypothetical protein L9F63_007847, partial [Diploptera punctata]